MSIVNSTYALDDHLQADGRVYVTETHTDSAGGVHTATYLATPGMDYAGIMAARAVQLSEQLAQQEIEGLLNGA